MKLKQFVISDEGLPCVNTIEKVYLSLLGTVFALGILSLFRLSYFKAEIRKVFDPRLGFTTITALFFVTIIFNFLWIPNQRLKWYGINPLEETEAKKLGGIYGEDCKCEFDLESDFKCDCEWNEKITLKEKKSFQDFRLVSKLGFNRQPHIAIDRL